MATTLLPIGDIGSGVLQLPYTAAAGLPLTDLSRARLDLSPHGYSTYENVMYPNGGSAIQGFAARQGGSGLVDVYLNGPGSPGNRNTHRRVSVVPGTPVTLGDLRRLEDYGEPEAAMEGETVDITDEDSPGSYHSYQPLPNGKILRAWSQNRLTSGEARFMLEIF